MMQDKGEKSLAVFSLKSYFYKLPPFQLNNAQIKMLSRSNPRYQIGICFF